MRSKFTLVLLVAILAFDSASVASRLDPSLLKQIVMQETAGPHTPAQPDIKD